MRNRLFCAVIVGLVAPFSLCGHFDSAVCSASEQSDEAKTPRLPDPACCFAGMIRAKVVAQHDEGLIVAVEKVERTWKANKAENPEALVGKTVLINGPKTDNRYAEKIDEFIKSLRAGETVTLDVAHKGEGEALTILELTEDQRARRPMLYVREAAGSVEEVLKKLEEAATANKFGVLTVHDLKQKLNAKGVDFGPECSIVEVCNPQKAKSVLEADMSISNALPCRISIYEENGTVKVSTLRPTAILGLFGRPELEPIAEEVEEAMIRMIDAACR